MLSITLTNVRAFTLIELIISIAVTSILAVIALPNYNDFIVQMRVDNEISQLYRTLLLTRNSAINSGSRAILCPLNDSSECTTQWQNELSVFVDGNNNNIFDANEQVIQIRAAITEGDSLVYGKGRNKITFNPTGSLSGLANGTFKYCPKTNKNRARGIIIARSGRLYQSRDSNNDGIEENRNNKKISCN